MAIKVRDYFEKQGYKVDYDAGTGNIRVWDPKTGASSNILKGAYTNTSGTSIISSDVAKSIEKELASGKYNVYESGKVARPTTPTTPSKPSTPAYSTPSKPTNYYQPPQQPQYQQPRQQYQQQQQQYSPQDFAYAMQEALQQYSFPYEQALRDLISLAPRYEMPSEKELERQAREWAELQINPQLAELTRALEQAQQALGTRQQQVEASYAGMEEAVNRVMAEQAQRALESAIARGGGQSGAVEWLTSKLQQPIAEQFTSAQAQKAAELADIASRLAMLQEQAGTQRTQLQERLGQLEANRLAELRNLAYAQATGNWQQVMQSVSNLAQMATQAQQYSQQLAASLLPYYTLTEQQRQYQPMSWAELMGEVPEAPTVPSSGGGVVPLRSFVSQQGGSIDYDPATGQVIINGRRYGRDVLESLGGSLQNGSWYLPESAVRFLMGGY